MLRRQPKWWLTLKKKKEEKECFLHLQGTMTLTTSFYLQGLMFKRIGSLKFPGFLIKKSMNIVIQKEIYLNNNVFETPGHAAAKSRTRFST